MKTENAIQKWLDGQVSLGAAAQWEKNEIRIISEIAYSLGLQGCHAEAIILFEGLLSIAPATAYFHAALGALLLRTGEYAAAVEHLNAALVTEPNDIAALVNRAEANLRAGNPPAAKPDLEKAITLGGKLTPRQIELNPELVITVKRARALNFTLTQKPKSLLETNLNE